MTESLRTLQLAWARHLRDPSHPPLHDVAPQRMALYRSLCVGAVENLLASSFPRLRRALQAPGWQALVTRFYARHRCETPLFPEVGGELVDYLSQADTSDLPGWVAELAHFEWTRQALLLAATTAPATGCVPMTADSVPMLSPLVRVCGYRWPVDAAEAGLSGLEDPPDAPTLLIVQRGADHELRTLRVTAFSYRLLLAVSAQPLSSRDHLRALAEEAGEPADRLLEHGLDVLARLQALGIVDSQVHTTGSAGNSRPHSNPSTGASA
ncbi:hypothetical protein GLA29479_356 [Lysobacter antibioticus]|uniref:Uncharacterized protein n=1 Tax=Lysobacter antibioticus TaxID=84531 RepID=A0A0S2DRR5_LYSAN|nr:putative DNA-binding domain-containing protein [Lysobacter antibioticus]ALN61242.1 hypothetical protein GLA29479_356 [Lysobacter antibioticus]ALN83190.1 hypothetical protein LA76x_5088 [Lysobacter antibioticus]